ncbi:MAG: TlpA disulfide reductase family protein [Wenzhouxiangellaceae bacterium]
MHLNSLNPAIRHWLLLLFITVSGLNSVGAATLELQPFTQDSLTQIQHRHQGENWALLLWSVDCPPCYEELATLQLLASDYPDIRVEVVATDPPERHVEVKQALEEFQLEGLSHWHFSTDHSQSLRYQIDPRWIGELPRSYFYSGNGERTAHRGVISAEALISHLR